MDRKALRELEKNRIDAARAIVAANRERDKGMVDDARRNREALAARIATETSITQDAIIARAKHATMARQIDADADAYRAEREAREAQATYNFIKAG